MKLRKLIILAVAPMMCLAASAQDNTPKKGDFTVAATVSYNNYTNISTPAGNKSSYPLSSAYENWSDKQLAVGLEGGWFFQDLWKVTLGGGMSITTNPGYDKVEGTGSSLGDIPTYEAVSNESNIQFHVYTGVDRYFDNLFKVKNLMPYAGVRIGYAYGRNSAYGDETWMGKSMAESFNIRGALTAGIDYFISDAIFMGIQVDPFAYTYNKTSMIPQEGLANMEASADNFSFLAAPTLKVGFKF